MEARDNEPSLSGIRDRGTPDGRVRLRASELATLDVDQIKPQERGLTIELTHFNTNQDGDLHESLSSLGAPARTTAPVTAVRRWLTAGGIIEGLIFS